MKLKMIAVLLSTAEGGTNSEIGHRLIFDEVASDFFQQDHVKDLIKIKFPKSWEKWTNNKSSQLENLGKKAELVFKRCGQESPGYEIDYETDPMLAPVRDPESSEVAKACALKDWIFLNANRWTEAHLSSCRSYQKNNHFEKRIQKWDKIYNRVFDCETEPPPTESPTTPPTTPAPEEPLCGCYALNEEIPIENDKCVLDLSQVSDVKGNWSFAFDLKINSLPTEATDPPYSSGIDWFAQIVTVLKDGANGFPTELLGMGHYPNMFAKYTVKGSSHTPGIQFETNQWYKFTVTGSPVDGEMCKQDLLIEGPGMTSWVSGQGIVDGAWASSVTNWCLDLDKDSPLRVFTTPDVSYTGKCPIDGVVRNVFFTETSNDQIASTTIVSPCSEIEPPTTVAPEPPTTMAPEEPECGCYAPDEEISIESDKCVMNLGVFPDLENEWSFTFDLKINSLPDGPTDPEWFLYIISAYMDGGSFPNKLISINYVQSDTLSIWWMRSTLASPGFKFQVDEWYKFSLTGYPVGDQCKQELLIEGPGLILYIPGEGIVDGKWTASATNPCIVMNEKTPLKVYATQDLTYYHGVTPIDGVVRNFEFTNIASDTTMNNYCPTPPPECGCYDEDEEILIEHDKCVLALGSFPDVTGHWSLEYEMKINSLPEEPTDPRWFFEILSVLKDGATEFPTGMLNIAYIQEAEYPNLLSIENTIGSMSSGSVQFEVGQWYKFTITGSPDGMECRQSYSITGPGLVYNAGSDWVQYGSWSFSLSNECLVLEDEYPLKVFATKNLVWQHEGTPMDGVLRNIAWTNTATGSTMSPQC